MWAAKRRDDIAHGVAGSYMDEGIEYGVFLTPPDYNTGRTFARAPINKKIPLSYLTARYRFTSADIMKMANKFDQLEEVLRIFYISLVKVDGVIPLVRDLPPAPEEKTPR